MRTEQAKKKLADLDTALLNLKHSITTNVKNFSVPSSDLLTEIGLNVLRRAQTVRDSLVQSMKQATSAKRRRKVSVKTAKAATKKKATSKRKPATKKKSVKRK